MEEKCLKNERFHLFKASSIPKLKISPNGAYLAYE